MKNDKEFEYVDKALEQLGKIVSENNHFDKTVETAVDRRVVAV